MRCERCETGQGHHARDCDRPAPRLGRAMRAAENPRQRRLVLQATSRVLLTALRLPATVRAEFQSLELWSRHRRELVVPWGTWVGYHARLNLLAAVPRTMTVELAPVALTIAWGFGMQAHRCEFERDRAFAGLLVFEAIEAVATAEGEGRLAFEGNAVALLDRMHTRAARRPDARAPR